MSAMPIRYSKYLPFTVLLSNLLLLNGVFLQLFGTVSPSVSTWAILLLLNVSWVAISRLFRIGVIPRPLDYTGHAYKLGQALALHLFCILLAALFFSYHHLPLSRLVSS